jgi:hypothetical protein
MAESAKGQGVFHGEIVVNNHSFCARIKEGSGTDLFTGLLSNQENSDHYRRGTYISYSSTRYRFRVKGVKEGNGSNMEQIRYRMDPR